MEGQAAYDREAKSCGKLFFSDTSQNLVRDFFLKEKLRGFAKDSDYSPKHVHVIGAGTMGGDIAAWCALRGMNRYLTGYGAALYCSRHQTRQQTV